MVHGRDITSRGGPDELLLEMFILIKAKKWGKVVRGLWHTFVVVWILLLPILVTQFGKWKREVCSDKISIIDARGNNSNDWFSSRPFGKEDLARMALTFRYNFGIGMSTNATAASGLNGDGRPEPITDPVVYSISQCLLWTGESYDGCESNQEVKETFNSTVRVVPTFWPRKPLLGFQRGTLLRTDLPYTQSINYHEQQLRMYQSSVRCLNTFEIDDLYLCTFKSDNAWHVADISAAKSSEEGVVVQTLKLEGISMEEGEWIWYATTIAAEINGGGFSIHNVNDARQMAMLFARFDYLLRYQTQICRVVQEESFVLSYVWIVLVAITAILAGNMVWSMRKHRKFAHIPLRSFEWYMHFAREREVGGGGLQAKPPSMAYYHKKFVLSPGTVHKGSGQSHTRHLRSNEREGDIHLGSEPTLQHEGIVCTNPMALPGQEDMSIELPTLPGPMRARAQHNRDRGFVGC